MASQARTSAYKWIGIIVLVLAILYWVIMMPASSNHAVRAFFGFLSDGTIMIFDFVRGIFNR